MAQMVRGVVAQLVWRCGASVGGGVVAQLVDLLWLSWLEV